MKKSIFLTLGLVGALLIGTTACNNKSAETGEGEEAVTEELEQKVPNVDFNTAMTIFNDSTKRTDTATDSTYAQTATGLKYIVVTEGSGKQPTAENQVTVHYTGQLTNGKVFDSSISRGVPASFPLSGVIPGWTEGLQLMKEGGITIFYIPSELGYGARGAGNDIGPNEDLVFTVQLISVDND